MSLSIPKSISTHLIVNNINFPIYWNVDIVVDAIINLDTQDMYKYFGCGSSASFTRMMNPYFPDRPKGESFSKYLRSIVESTPKTKFTVKTPEERYDGNN